MAGSGCPRVWLKNVRFDLGFPNKYAQPCIYADNLGALSLAEKDEVDERSKAIDSATEESTVWSSPSTSEMESKIDKFFKE